MLFKFNKYFEAMKFNDMNYFFSFLIYNNSNKDLLPVKSTLIQNWILINPHHPTIIPTNTQKQPTTPNNINITTIHPVVVLLYTLLYAAFFGLVIQPQPLGALKPRFWRTYLFRDVLAAMRLLRFGMRKPNFINKVYCRYI